MEALYQTELHPRDRAGYQRATPVCDRRATSTIVRAMSDTAEPRGSDAPPYRYTARLANEIEPRWQDRWEQDRTFWTPNPTGPLSEGFERVDDRTKLYVLD